MGSLPTEVDFDGSDVGLPSKEAPYLTAMIVVRALPVASPVVAVLGGRKTRCVKALPVCLISRPGASAVFDAGPEL